MAGLGRRWHGLCSIALRRWMSPTEAASDAADVLEASLSGNLGFRFVDLILAQSVSAVFACFAGSARFVWRVFYEDVCCNVGVGCDDASRDRWLPGEGAL